MISVSGHCMYMLLFQNLSNCCMHKCNWSFSRIFQITIFGGNFEFDPTVRRSRLAQRFTTSRALVSLLISSFSYLCALNVFTLACFVQTDRQVKSGNSVWYLLTIVVRVFFTNHKVLISSASLIPSLQTTRWKINQNIELYFFSNQR